MKKFLIILIVINLLFNVFIIAKILTENHYDVNGDGKVDSKDLLDLKKYLLGSDNRSE